MDETNVQFNTIGNKDRLVDRVVNAIRQMIVDGQLLPGMRLPSERELAERVGVSRTVVREAVHILVAKGLLETRHGVGTIVRQMTSDLVAEPLSLLMQTQGLTLDHIHQVRVILEAATVRLAAQQADAQELARLSAIIEEMPQRIGQLDEFVALDDAFHHALAEMTHNPLIVMLAETIGQIMHEVRVHVHQFGQVYATSTRDHQRIFGRVAAGDADGASQAMLDHLEHARRFQAEYTASKENGHG